MFGKHAKLAITGLEIQISNLRRELDWLQMRYLESQRRCDRLMEALASKNDVQLQMPFEPSAPVPDIPGPTTDTGINQWWVAVGGSPRIATPVKEEKVAPNS